MKPLLLLLLSVGLVIAEHLPQRRCDNGVLPGYYVNVSAVRTDWCNDVTLKIELWDCHIPEKNKTIPGNKDIEEIINGKKFVTRCIADGNNGIDIVTRAAEEVSVVESTKVPGFCTEGTKMWIPNAQWDEGDYVKQCNPDTFKTEIIACRSHDGTFVPRGSDRTDVIVTPNGGRRTIMIKCLVVGSGTQIERKYSEGGSPKLPKTTETPTTKQQHTTRTIFTPQDCTKEENLDKFWVQNGVELRCVRGVMNSLLPKAVACSSGGPLKINGHYRIPLGKTQYVIDRGLLKCSVNKNGTIAIEFVKEKCENGKELGDEWEEDGFVKTCVDDGITLDGIIPIVAIKACLSEGIKIPVGEQRRIDNGLCECFRTSIAPAGCPTERAALSCRTIPNTIGDYSKKFILKPYDCSKMENLGKYWYEGSFVRECKKVEFGIMDVAVRCITSSGDTIEVDQERIYTDGTVHDCVRVNLTEARLDRLTSKAAALPRKCSNGKRINSTWTVFGPELDSLGLEWACQLDKSGNTTAIAVACIYRNWLKPGKYDQIPLGVTADIFYTYHSEKEKCLLTPEGKPTLERIAKTCENGKKFGEEWREDRFIKRCDTDRTDMDAVSLVIVVKACIVSNVTIPVGEEKETAEKMTCKCERYTPFPKDESEYLRKMLPALKANVVCEEVGPSNIQASTMPTKSEPKTTIVNKFG